MEVIDAVRDAVDSQFVVAVKLNATDQLEGGLEETDALRVISALHKTSIDLIDISGGTYFPGAKADSDSYLPGAKSMAENRTEELIGQFTGVDKKCF